MTNASAIAFTSLGKCQLKGQKSFDGNKTLSAQRKYLQKYLILKFSTVISETAGLYNLPSSIVFDCTCFGHATASFGVLVFLTYGQNRKKKKKNQTSGRLKLVPLKLFEHPNVTVHALTRLLNFSVNSDVRFRLFISRRSWRVREWFIEQG